MWRVVASFTDAWIETDQVENLILKLDVASFTDAWIETNSEVKLLMMSSSHLLQMRGLKHPERLILTYV